MYRRYIKSQILLSLILITCIFSINSDANTKFKKVIKNGKVTYLPVKNSEVKDKTISNKNLKTEGKAQTDNVTKNKAKERNKALTGDVVLFESSSCNDCRRIRRFFFSNQIEYTRKDVDISKKYNFQLAQKTGDTKTPALYIGKRRINDLSTENLKDIFEINAVDETSKETESASNETSKPDKKTNEANQQHEKK